MKKKHKSMGDRILSKIAQMLEFPEDVIRNVPRIFMVDNLELRVENSMGVLKYSPEHLKIKTPQGNLIVDGKGMVIKAIMPEEIIIRGEILHLQLDFRGGS